VLSVVRKPIKEILMSNCRNGLCGAIDCDNCFPDYEEQEENQQAKDEWLLDRGDHEKAMEEYEDYED